MDTLELDIVANAAHAGNFSTLSNAFKAAGLDATYRGPGPFTLFAPTDSAFNKLAPGELNGLLRDKAKLASILNFHITRGIVLEADIKAHDLPSIQGEALSMSSNESGFTVNGAKGSKQEIRASNGVIHAIDTVMMPAG